MIGTTLAVLLALVAGGFAGWIAGKKLHVDKDVTGDVVLGVIGAAMASSVLFALGFGLNGLIGDIVTGLVGYIAAGLVGAILLIATMKALRR